MSGVTSPAGVPVTGGHAGWFWPQTKVGRWAMVFAVLALLSLIVLPSITMAFRDTYPVVDTWVMPAINTVLLDTAAVIALLALWRKGERSAVGILSLVLTAPIGLFFTLSVLGELTAG